MALPSPPPDREARLAEQLRANLRRRKAQARALAPAPDDSVPDPLAAADLLAHREPPR